MAQPLVLSDPETPRWYALVGSDGLVLSTAAADVFAPGQGERVIALDRDPLAEVAEGEEAIHDGKTIVRRKRAESPEEGERRGLGELLPQIDAAIDGWAALTTAQRWAVVLLLLRAVRAIVRRVLR